MGFGLSTAFMPVGAAVLQDSEVEVGVGVGVGVTSTPTGLAGTL